MAPHLLIRIVSGAAGPQERLSLLLRRYVILLKLDKHFIFLFTSKVTEITLRDVLQGLPQGWHQHILDVLHIKEVLHRLAKSGLDRLFLLKLDAFPHIDVQLAAEGLLCVLVPPDTLTVRITFALGLLLLVHYVAMILLFDLFAFGAVLLVKAIDSAIGLSEPLQLFLLLLDIVNEDIQAEVLHPVLIQIVHLNIYSLLKVTDLLHSLPNNYYN